MTKIDLESFLQVVKEFLKALGQEKTYNIRENWYSFFGILWGIPIPIVTIGIDLYSSNLAPTFDNIMRIILSHPFHIFFFLHPVFFGIVFGAMGTVRHNKEEKIKEFEKHLIDKNTELRRANKELQDLDRVKTNFLSMVSHELRTPLTTIQGYVTFLGSEKPGALNPAQKECLKISEETADHLNRLIEELLALSKIEKVEFKVNLTGVDMGEVVGKALGALRLFAVEHDVSLENMLPEDIPLLRADAERIFQVVTNLFENAVKSNRRGGR